MRTRDPLYILVCLILLVVLAIVLVKLFANVDVKC